MLRESVQEMGAWYSISSHSSFHQRYAHEANILSPEPTGSAIDLTIWHAHTGFDSRHECIQLLLNIVRVIIVGVKTLH